MNYMPAFSPKRLEWSQQFHRCVKSYLGNYFFRDATLDEDRNEATDLKIYRLRAPNITVAVRIRTHRCIQYRQQVTLRYVSNDCETEFDKIRRGFGDYFFYGFADPTASKIPCFVFIDLAAWRLRWHTIKAKVERMNGDGVTGFAAFDVIDLDAYHAPPIILECSGELRRELDNIWNQRRVYGNRNVTSY